MFTKASTASTSSGPPWTTTLYGSTESVDTFRPSSNITVDGKRRFTPLPRKNLKNIPVVVSPPFRDTTLLKMPTNPGNTEIDLVTKPSEDHDGGTPVTLLADTSPATSLAINCSVFEI